MVRSVSVRLAWRISDSTGPSFDSFMAMREVVVCVDAKMGSGFR